MKLLIATEDLSNIPLDTYYMSLPDQVEVTTLYPIEDSGLNSILNSEELSIIRTSEATDDYDPFQEEINYSLSELTTFLENNSVDEIFYKEGELIREIEILLNDYSVSQWSDMSSVGYIKQEGVEILIMDVEGNWSIIGFTAVLEEFPFEAYEIEEVNYPLSKLESLAEFDGIIAYPLQFVLVYKDGEQGIQFELGFLTDILGTIEALKTVDPNISYTVCQVVRELTVRQIFSLYQELSLKDTDE